MPDDLEETAVDLFRRNTENDKTFVQSQRIEVMPVWYWTDASNWCLTTDPDDIPTIEIGFLDGNEEPELFVQDSPTNGSMFTHDKLTWKIRHIYGGNVLDYRGMLVRLSRNIYRIGIPRRGRRHLPQDDPPFEQAVQPGETGTLREKEKPMPLRLSKPD